VVVVKNPVTNHHHVQDQDLKIKLMLVVVLPINHQNVNPDHQVKINLLVEHLINDHDQVVNKMVEKITNHQKVNHVHQAKINLVVVEKLNHQAKINLVDQHLVHQVNHKITKKINNKKILKQKVNNNQNLHQQKKLESLVVVIAKRQVNDREESNLSHYILFCLYIRIR
jgi:hypothetical protein